MEISVDVITFCHSTSCFVSNTASSFIFCLIFTCNKICLILTSWTESTPSRSHCSRTAALFSHDFFSFGGLCRFTEAISSSCWCGWLGGFFLDLFRGGFFFGFAYYCWSRLFFCNKDVCYSFWYDICSL